MMITPAIGQNVKERLGEPVTSTQSSVLNEGIDKINSCSEKGLKGAMDSSQNDIDLDVQLMASLSIESTTRAAAYCARMWRICPFGIHN